MPHPAQHLGTNQHRGMTAVTYHAPTNTPHSKWNMPCCTHAMIVPAEIRTPIGQVHSTTMPSMLLCDGQLSMAQAHSPGHIQYSQDLLFAAYQECPVQYQHHFPSRGTLQHSAGQPYLCSGWTSHAPSAPSPGQWHRSGFRHHPCPTCGQP